MKKIFQSYIIFLILFSSNILFANTQANYLEKVTLQLEWKHQFEFAGFYTAIKKGYYKDVGLEVEIREFKDGIDITQEVLSGNATFGISSSALILEKLDKKPVVLIASYFKQNALALVTKPDIKTPNDLKNKKIMALNWEMQHTSLGVMLKDTGISSNDYTLINHDFKVDKFVNGQIDAMSVFISSQPYELDQAGVKYNILNPADFGIYSYDVELFTSQKVINLNTKKVKDFVEATNKGWEYAFNHKEEIVDLIYDKYSKRKTKESLLFEAKQTEKLFKTNIFKIGAIAPELVKLNADMYTKLGLVDKNYDINSILNNYYFDINNKIQGDLTNEEKNYLKDTRNKENALLQEILKKGKNDITDEELFELRKRLINTKLDNNDKLKKTIPLNEKEKNYLLNKKSITMCVDPDWEPFEKLDNKGKYTGIAENIIELISSKLALNIKVIPTKSWEESIEFSKAKKCDIMSFLNETPQRKEWLNFTEPVFDDPNVIIGRSDSQIIKDLSKIKASIALPKETAMYEKFQNDFPNLMIIPTNTENEAFELVEEKKADLTLRSIIISAYNIKEKGFFNLKILNEPKGYGNIFRIGVLKDEPILVDILNKAILTISKNDIQDIVNKWISIKYEKIEDYTYLWISISFIIILLIFFLYRQYLLKDNNNFLQNEIKKRTQELDKLNEELEIRVNEELEKNKLFQEKLFKADKLASMGEMISNIAHQWRQPLSMISTVATGVKIQKEFGTLDDNELIQNMDLINKNSQYLSETINDFKNFIKEDRKLRNYNLSTTINNFLHIVESTVRNDNLKLILNLDDNITIDGYPNELIQCLINIFNNAKDALEERQEEFPLVFITTTIKNNIVYISIKDNAGGIQEDIISKIYDPYFTTKYKSQGTGLGLHMTYKLIDEGMHGKIEAKNVEYTYENKIYKGAEFVITLNI
jgi:two-component system, NarL family, sensor histidine kinase EvgS